MESKIRSRYVQIAKELLSHFNGPNYRSEKKERAFIDWYIEARFGKLAVENSVVVDGKNDGGIDAIVRNENFIYVFQMKYEIKPSISTVKRDEISGFEKVARFFKDPGCKNDFEKWLQTVRPELQKQYKNIYKSINEGHAVRFVFVTSKEFTYPEGDLVEVEDIQKILSLWDLYREGFTPPAEEIKLKIDHHWHYPSQEGTYETYIGLADVRGFLNLMKDDRNERLFAQNVRTDLKSTINKSISETYKKQPDIFWLGNNGIYIVCKKVTISGDEFKLIFPSIINGSQTLHSIFNSGTETKCNILVRILVMDVIGNQGLLSSVVKRTNTQNPMKLINLAAHDHCQLNIARFLDRYNVFYERREREWQNEKRDVLNNYIPINIKDLSQWLSTINEQVGFGRARARTSELFQDKYYSLLFGNFDTNFKSDSYNDLIDIVWSGLFIKNFIRNLPSNKKVFAKMSQLLFIGAMARAIKTSDRSHGTIVELISEGRFGHKYFPRAIQRILKNAVDDFRKIQKQWQKKDENLDFSNFFKRDDLTKKAFNKVFSGSIIRRLQKQIIQQADQIK